MNKIFSTLGGPLSTCRCRVFACYGREVPHICGPIFAMKQICLVGIVAVLASLGPTTAYASCGDRPGTPTNIRAIGIVGSTGNNNPGILVTWINTASESGADFVDIEVQTQDGGATGFNRTGWRMEGGGFHKEGSATFQPMEVGKTFCFRVRARTEAGTQGCVSQLWTSRVCAAAKAEPNNRGTDIGFPTPVSYASVASAVSGAWGASIMRTGRVEDAVADAIRRCSGRCDTLIKGEGECVAVAEPLAPHIEIGYAIGKSKDDVSRRALAMCEARAPGLKCRLAHSNCIAN